LASPTVPWAQPKGGAFESNHPEEDAAAAKTRKINALRRQNNRSKQKSQEKSGKNLLDPGETWAETAIFWLFIVGQTKAPLRFSRTFHAAGLFGWKIITTQNDLSNTKARFI
jgi:hypothetical protein